MKRVQLEPWTTQEKLCLVSAIHKTGDQNWTAVSRATRNLFEETVTREPSPERRPSDWFNMKQCAAQYENLLKTVAAPRRKKRTEKGSDVSEAPVEIIAGVLRQEFMEELKVSINEDYAQYIKLKKEKEDAEAGLLDDKLEELIADYEAKENERETKKKLKFKLGEKLTTEEMKQEVVDQPSTPVPTEPEVKTSAATSPLLTSLLQSPSPLTRTTISSNAPPTISLLLNSSPSVPVNESPTLSKLLESPTSITVPFTTSPVKESPTKAMSPPPQPIMTYVVKQEPVPPENKEPDPTPPPPPPPPSSPPAPVKEEPEQPVETTEQEVEEVEEDVEPPQPEPAPATEPTQIADVVESEVVIEELPVEEKEAPISKAEIDFDDIENVEEVMETVEEMIEKVEEAIIETVGETTDEDLCDDDLNMSLEPETMEDNIEHLELDQETVERIVVGPSQPPVVTVCHEEPSESPAPEPEVQTKEEDEPELVEEEEEPKEEEEEEEPKEEEEEAKESSDTEVIKESERLEEEPVKSVESKDDTNTKLSDEDEESKPEPESETEEEKTSPEEVKVEESEEIEELTEENTPEEKAESPQPTPEEPEETLETIEPTPEETPTEPDDIKEEAEAESSDEKKKKRKLSSKSDDEEDSQKLKRTRLSPSINKEPEPITPAKDEPSKGATTPQVHIQENKKPIETPTASEQPKSPKVATTETPKEEKKEEVERRRGTRKRVSVISQSDSKPNSPASALDEDKDYKMWKKSMLLEYNRLASHKYASVFLKPIKANDAVGYYSVVKRPMDLSTIKRNIETGAIRTTVEFQRDLLLMVQNAIMYNKRDTLAYKMAQDMLVDIIDQLQLMVDAIGDGVPLASDSYERLSTRARASKQGTEETSKRKRSSIGESEAVRQSKRKKTDSSGSL